MNRQLLIVAAAAVAGALAYAAWRGESGTPDISAAWAGAGIDWGKPARHGCDPTWLGAIQPVPHPVYRQGKPGTARAGLQRYGWNWILNPPSEESI